MCYLIFVVDIIDRFGKNYKYRLINTGWKKLIELFIFSNI